MNHPSLPGLPATQAIRSRCPLMLVGLQLIYDHSRMQLHASASVQREAQKIMHSNETFMRHQLCTRCYERQNAQSGSFGNDASMPIICRLIHLTLVTKIDRPQLRRKAIQRFHEQLPLLSVAVHTFFAAESSATDFVATKKRFCGCPCCFAPCNENQVRALRIKAREWRTLPMQTTPGPP